MKKNENLSTFSKLPEWGVGVLAGTAAFFTYLCFYPFRRSYTAATFDDLYFFGVHFKILIITAQVLGFAVSKGIGVKVVSELHPSKRPRTLVILTFISMCCMLAFGLSPAPYNLIFVFLGSLPLGMFYGIILGFLEGRKITDFLVAALTASFIIGSGFAKSIGSWIIKAFSVSEFIMPFYADVLMFLPLVFFVWLLSKVPPPTKSDLEDRTERLPMNKSDRGKFISEFKTGLYLFIGSYVILTAFRELRDNFTPELMKELGYGNNTAIFTQTEIPIAVFVLILMASMRFIKNNKKAFYIIQLLLLVGGVIVGASTILYQLQLIGPILWIISTGFGAYVAYSMCNSLYFERMLATYKYAGTVGFMITLSDYYAYFGSILVLFYKNFFHHNTSNLNFFIYACYALSIFYFILVLGSILYFRKKTISKP